MRKFLFPGLFLAGLIWAIFSFQGLASQGEFQQIVLDFRESPSIDIKTTVESINQKYNVKLRLNSEFSVSDNIYIIEGDRHLLNRLRQDFGTATEFIEPDFLYSAPEPPQPESALRPPEANASPAATSPNDPMYTRQWNLKAIGVEQAWAKNRGKGVIVAVLDTGISPVPDLAKTPFVAGYDFVNDRPQALDDHGHGTHVAGTIAQSTNNAYGVAGVAYEATLMPLKVLSGRGSGTTADIAEAIKFAADHRATVINMSLGGGGASQLMQEAIDYAYQKGVTIIAAAGNENANAALYPARYNHVIGVSAHDSSGHKAPYSNYGAGVDLAAPGGALSRNDSNGGILQQTISPGSEPFFVGLQGTSMASPHVAGVAALVEAMGVRHPDEVESVLLRSAIAVESDPKNFFGAGKLNAAKAVEIAQTNRNPFWRIGQWLRNLLTRFPKLWIDWRAIADLPKLAMVLGAYLLLFVVGLNVRQTGSLGWGLVLGSVGLFPLKALYIYDLPQWPLRVLGSSLPELGGAILGHAALNPITASVLIPFGLAALLIGNPTGKQWVTGLAIGVAACLLVSAALLTPVWGLGGILAPAYLLINALLCLALAHVIQRPD